MSFVFRAVDEVGATLNTALVVMGDKLGYYRAMADGRPITPGRAGRADRHQRAYAREWLNTQAAGGYVEYDAETRRYTLPAEQAVALTDPTQPGVPAGLLPARARHGPGRAGASSRPRATATGSAGTQHNSDVHDGCERFFRTMYNAHLIDRVAPGARRRRRRSSRRGARVADVGCGHGASTILMAQAFPNVDVRRLGLPRGVDRGRPRACRGGRGRRPGDVRGRPGDRVHRHRLRPGRRCSTACTTWATRSARPGTCASAIADDGTWMVVEPMAGDRVEDNLNPVGRAYYGFSTLLCTPASLSPGRRARARHAGRPGQDPRRRHGRRVHALPDRREHAVQQRVRGPAVTTERLARRTLLG